MGRGLNADFRDLKVSGWEVRFGTNVYFLFNLQLLIPKVESFVNRLGVTPFATDEYLRGTRIRGKKMFTDRIKIFSLASEVHTEY